MLPRHMAKLPSLADLLLPAKSRKSKEPKQLELVGVPEPEGKEKLCPGCLEVLPHSYFYREKRTGRLGSRCKACAKQVTKEAYQQKKAREAK